MPNNCLLDDRKKKYAFPVKQLMTWQKHAPTQLSPPFYYSKQMQLVRRVLLVCHKNKWRDLSQKFVTSLFKTMFLFIEGGQENIFIGPKNIFDQ